MTGQAMPAAFFGHGSPMNALDHNRYIKLGSVRHLKAELDATGIVSKIRRRPGGTIAGGTPFFLM